MLEVEDSETLGQLTQHPLLCRIPEEVDSGRGSDSIMYMYYALCNVSVRMKIIYFPFEDVTS